jgi:hypothetical protein
MCSSTCQVRLLALVVALHDVLNGEACMVGGGEVDWLLCTLQAAAADWACRATSLSHNGDCSPVVMSVGMNTVWEA